MRRFPTFAVAHNTVAYQLAPTDPDGALAEIREYVRLAPSHPNSHDSFADILLLRGRPADALPHVQREMELDSEIAAGTMKLGLIHLMMGDVATARADFARGQEHFTDPATMASATRSSRFAPWTWKRAAIRPPPPALPCKPGAKTWWRISIRKPARWRECGNGRISATWKAIARPSPRI